MGVERRCTCMCAYIIFAFVPSFVKSFQTWLTCNQMHFPPNCQKMENESKQSRRRARWGKMQSQDRRGRLKVRDQKKGVHFALYIVNICCIQGMTVWAVYPGG